MDMTTELAEYNVWLQTRRGHASRTASVYASLTRRALADLSFREAKNITQWTSEEIETVVNTGSPQMQSNRRIAWNGFADFMAPKGVVIAKARAASKAGTNVPPMPTATLEALVALTVRMHVSIPTLLRLSWRHVKMQPVGSAYLVDPLASKGVWVMMAREVVEGLREWAQPQEDENTPLIPESPGSLTPMSSRVLRAAFQQFVRTL
jgi:hypothetical protein